MESQSARFLRLHFARSITMSDNCFTLVFKGNIAQVNGNPMKIKTPFGIAIASCAGDAIEESDRLRDALDTIEHTTDDISAERVAHNALMGR